MKTKTMTRTVTRTDTGLELSHKPQDDNDIIITEKDGKITLRYLVQDCDAQPPNEGGDNGIFLVNYHRDFYVRNDKIITKDTLVDWYQGQKIEQSKTYWIFRLGMYSHSGVCLKLESREFVGDTNHWDSSMVGAVLVSKKEWKLSAKARKAAECLVQEWNNYLIGDVWGCVTDVFDAKTKERIEAECESCWGYNSTYREAFESMRKGEM
jgi:hypothetical protein